MSAVNSFIKRFHSPRKNNNIDYIFTNGCCYWFAKILCDRFEGATMFYAPVEGHFVTRIDGRLYDITGDVTDRYHNLIEWDAYEKYDVKERDRIIEQCINF